MPKRSRNSHIPTMNDVELDDREKDLHEQIKKRADILNNMRVAAGENFTPLGDHAKFTEMRNAKTLREREKYLLNEVQDEKRRRKEKKDKEEAERAAPALGQQPNLAMSAAIAQFFAAQQQSQEQAPQFQHFQVQQPSSSSSELPPAAEGAGLARARAEMSKIPVDWNQPPAPESDPSAAADQGFADWGYGGAALATSSSQPAVPPQAAPPVALPTAPSVLGSIPGGMFARGTSQPLGALPLSAYPPALQAAALQASGAGGSSTAMPLINAAQFLGASPAMSWNQATNAGAAVPAAFRRPVALPTSGQNSVPAAFKKNMIILK